MEEEYDQQDRRLEKEITKERNWKYVVWWKGAVEGVIREVQFKGNLSWFF